jgi:hypothetical protein
MMKYRFSVVAVAAGVALTGCKDESREQINNVFDAYIAALRNHDGAAAIELVDERYFEDMDVILNAAKFAPREQVWKMRPSDRARIVAIRNRLTKEEMKGLDGRGLMKMSIDKDDTEEGDTPERHAEDTIAAGAGIVDREIALGLVAVGDHDHALDEAGGVQAVGELHRGLRVGPGARAGVAGDRRR